MANEMPNFENYQGLSRKVFQYAESFRRLLVRMKQPDFSNADWADLEAIVDIKRFQRVGELLTDRAEISNWPQYKQMLTQYGGPTTWEGTLRRITEISGLVYLELEERNIRDNAMEISNTVTIYEFSAAEKLCKLDVYVAPMGRRQLNG